MHIPMAAAASPGGAMERNCPGLIRGDIEFVTINAGCVLMRPDKLETGFAVIECQRLRPRPIGVTGFAPATEFLA